MKQFDKATELWFLQNPFAETTVMECDKCGLVYKPSLGHTCKHEHITDLKSKCGSCVYAIQSTFGKSNAYVECSNREHIAKYCKRPISAIRQKTNPACKSYKERTENQ